MDACLATALAGTQKVKILFLSWPNVFFFLGANVYNNENHKTGRVNLKRERGSFNLFLSNCEFYKLDNTYISSTLALAPLPPPPPPPPSLSLCDTHTHNRQGEEGGYWTPLMAYTSRLQVYERVGLRLCYCNLSNATLEWQKGFLLLFAMDCHTRSVECNFIVVKIVRTFLITFCHSKK